MAGVHLLSKRRLALHSRTVQGLRSACVLLCLFTAGSAVAGGSAATARASIGLFAEHCFSPFLTADKARKVFALSGMSYDFYDLDPFSSAAPSPATNAAVTAGTDRRCEVTFSGNHAQKAASAAADALRAEGITSPAALPASFTETATTSLLAARQLNPRRIAVVHVGTREGPMGTETFMNVERLLPSDANN